MQIVIVESASKGTVFVDENVLHVLYFATVAFVVILFQETNKFVFTTASPVLI